uniref:Uncharacterized protein n=1 Tax=Arundo donax TaxID=35708 RepID=A0A0A9F670_ARUDO
MFLVLTKVHSVSGRDFLFLHLQNAEFRIWLLLFWLYSSRCSGNHLNEANIS